MLELEWVRWAQPAFYIVGILSAAFGIPRYLRATRRKMAETFIELEDRFAHHRRITRMIDPEVGESAELVEAIRKLLAKPPEVRSKNEGKLLAQFDDFLRFLLLLSQLQKNSLVSTEALSYMYYYWFNAVMQQPPLRRYVQVFFRLLSDFMDEHEDEFRKFA